MTTTQKNSDELVNRGEFENVKSYIRELTEDINDSEKVYNSGNTVIDGILNYYAGVFAHKTIKNEIKVVIPTELDMSAYDLNIVLGNLLDNAVENAVSSIKPMVVVDINYSGHVLYISIANTYDGMIKSCNDIFVSKKGTNHGYGLNNVKRITKKYNGDLKVEHNEEMFIVGVVMYV